MGLASMTCSDVKLKPRNRRMNGAGPRRGGGDGVRRGQHATNHVSPASGGWQLTAAAQRQVRDHFGSLVRDARRRCGACPPGGAADLYGATFVETRAILADGTVCVYYSRLRALPLSPCMKNHS